MNIPEDILKVNKKLILNFFGADPSWIQGEKYICRTNSFAADVGLSFFIPLELAMFVVQYAICYCSTTFWMDMAQLICGGCHTLFMHSRGAASVRCSCCHTVNLMPAPNHVAHVKCGNCHTMLMFPTGAPSVRCAICHYIMSTNDSTSCAWRELCFYINTAYFEGNSPSSQPNSGKGPLRDPFVPTSYFYFTKVLPSLEVTFQLNWSLGHAVVFDMLETNIVF